MHNLNLGCCKCCSLKQHKFNAHNIAEANGMQFVFFTEGGKLVSICLFSSDAVDVAMEILSNDGK